MRGDSPGACPTAVDAYRYEELAADVLAFGRTIGERYHLVGHDWVPAVGWVTLATDPTTIASYTALSCGHYGAFAQAVYDDHDSAAGLKNHEPRSLKGHRLPKRTRELLPLAEKDMACPVAQIELRATDSDYIAAGCGKFAAYSEKQELEHPPVAVDMTGLPPPACSGELTAPQQLSGGEDVDYPQETKDYAVSEAQAFACVIMTDGTVDRCQTVVGLPHGATEAALAALKLRKFKPTWLGTRPSRCSSSSTCTSSRRWTWTNRHPDWRPSELGRNGRRCEPRGPTVRHRSTGTSTSGSGPPPHRRPGADRTRPRPCSRSRASSRCCGGAPTVSCAARKRAAVTAGIMAAPGRSPTPTSSRR